MAKKEKRHILSDNAELIYQKNKITKSTALTICFPCGSRCDGDVPGLSHFCEHMFFTGNETEDKTEISRQYFDFIGANAYTNSQEICFTAEIFTSELKNYLDLVAKLITKSTFSPENVESEKKVVLQEIVQDSDNFNRKSLRRFSYLIYQEEYLDKGVLGDKKSVSSITSEMVKNYVNKYFVKNNCKIFVTSPLDEEEILSIFETHFLNKLKTNLDLTPLKYDCLKVVDKSFLKIKKDKIDKNFLYIGVKANITRKTIRELAYVWALCDIMSDYRYGLLKSLRLEKGLVYSGYFLYDDSFGDCELIFKTELESANIKPCIKCFCDYIKNLKENGVDEEWINNKLKENAYEEEVTVGDAKSILKKLETFKHYNRILSAKDVSRYQKGMTKEKLDKLINRIFDDPYIACFAYGDCNKSDIYSLKEIKDMLK